MERVTTRVECADYFEQRNSALLAHTTQIDPNGWFFAAPVEMQQRVWPTEEFELAASRVGFLSRLRERVRPVRGSRPVRRAPRRTEHE